MLTLTLDTPRECPCAYCPHPITPRNDWRFVDGGKAHRFCAAPGEQPRG